MISLDRRTVLKGTIAAGATAFVPAALCAASPRPVLFVFDARFAQSQALADAWQAQGVPVLDPRVRDLGVAWRQQIPGLLHQGARIEGATLWSDRFICETFGREHALTLRIAERPLANADEALRQWVLA